jgi:hypothetical protein
MQGRACRWEATSSGREAKNSCNHSECKPGECKHRNKKVFVVLIKDGHMGHGAVLQSVAGRMQQRDGTGRLD